MKKSALGRGLDVLLPDDISFESHDIRNIAIADIDRNPDQPRKEFNEEALQQLADSIRESGILQPILVTEHKGRYLIVAGERRFRAARIAGLDEIPCLVRDLSAEEQMEIALIENLQREDLNPMEEALAIRSLMHKCKYTQDKAAKRLGKSRPAVANALRLLNLPEEVQQAVASRQLSAGHARVLAGIEGENRQLALCRKVIAEGLSVRALEKLAAMPAEMPPVEKPVRQLPLELQDMENRLREVMGVRTLLKGSRKKGKIILQYTNADELDAIYAAMEKLEGLR